MNRFTISTLAVTLAVGLAHAAAPNGKNGNGNNGQGLPKMGNGNGNNNGNVVKDLKTKDPKVDPKDPKIDPKILKLDPKNQNVQKLIPKVDCKDYQCYNGLKYSFGWCFPGHVHCHWTYQCWFVDCGCYCNWCPSTCCYYYYCVPDCCWYPVSYCPYGKYVW